MGITLYANVAQTEIYYILLQQHQHHASLVRAGFGCICIQRSLDILLIYRHNQSAACRCRCNYVNMKDLTDVIGCTLQKKISCSNLGQFICKTCLVHTSLTDGTSLIKPKLSSVVICCCTITQFLYQHNVKHNNIVDYVLWNDALH